MAERTNISTAAANAQGDAIARMLDGGFLRIYNGQQPRSADASVSGATLVEFRFAAVSAPPVTDGVIKFAELETVRAKESGTATWYRCFMADGKTAILDGSVGTQDCNMNFDSADIRRNAQIVLSELTHVIVGKK